MDPLRKGVELCSGVPELVLRLGDNRRSWSVRRRPRLLQNRCDSGQAALGSGAELPLETTPLSIRSLDNPAPRGGELQDPCPHLRLKPGVGDSHPRGRGDGLDERRILQHRLVVDEDGDRVSVVHERRDRPPRARLRELDRPAGVIHVALLLGQPVAENERPVAERPTKLVPEGPRVGALAEVDHEIRDDGLRPAPAEQVDEEHDGERRNHDVVRPEGRSVGVPARKGSTAPKAITPANASAAASAGMPARRAVPEARRYVARGPRRPRVPLERA